MLDPYVDLVEFFRLVPRWLETDYFLYNKLVEFCCFIFLASVNDLSKTSFHDVIIAINTIIKI